MIDRRFRSRSESPSRMAQIGEPFVSCREWVERVNKVVTGIWGQIEAYEALWKYYSTFPPTYLIQGLLEAVAELEGPKKKPDSPIEKGRSEDGAQKVNGQVVEEEEIRDRNKTKNLLNQIYKQVNSSTRVPTKHQTSGNSHGTSQRMVRNESVGNTLLVKIPLSKVRQGARVKSKSKTPPVQINAESRKTSVCPRCGSGSARKANVKDRRQKVNTNVAEKEKGGQEKKLKEGQMKDNLNKNNQQLNKNRRVSKVGNIKSAASSNSSSSSGERENVNPDVEERENEGQVQKFEDDQMEVDSHQIGQQLDNDRRDSNRHQSTSKSEIEELKTTASRRSAGVNSGDGGSTVPKRARISMEKAIDSASSSSSVMKNVSEPSFCITSEPSCSTTSTSGFSSSSQSAKTTTLQVALRAKENPVQVALLEPRMSDGHDDKSEPDSGKNLESPQPAKRMRTNGNDVEDNNTSTSNSSLSEADRISSPLSNNGTTENVKVKMEIVNADVEEEEKAGQDKSLEEYQMKDESSQINQQVGNNAMVDLEYQNSTNTTSHIIGQVTIVRSKSKTEELLTTAMKVSADPNSNGSTPEKRVHMETVIDSASSFSSIMTDNSEPSCRSTSGSAVTLNAKRSPVQVALNEPKVLQNIFKFLPYSDLQSCLSVDLPLWASEAEYVLSQRPVLSITLRSEENTIVKTWQNKQTKFTCGKLWPRIGNREKGLEIRLDAFKVDWLILNTFFTIFSNDISKLTLWYNMFKNVAPSQLGESLCRLPNLSHLHLDRVHQCKWKEQKMTFPPQNASSTTSSLLPKIKIISFGSSDSFYPELLISLFEITPNLENIFNFPLNCIPNSTTDDDLLQLSKIRSVKFFNFPWRENEQKLTDLALLASNNQGIKLKMADLRFRISPDLEKPCCESLSRILNNNKNTLECLILGPLALPETLKYPKMEAVKKICLFISRKKKNQKDERVLQFFGDNFDAAKAFPNLVQVTLNSRGLLVDFLKFFPEDPGNRICFQGVKSLNVNINLVDHLKPISQVARLFPNVTELFMNIRFHGLGNNFSQFLQLWPKLQSLKMKIDRMRDYSEFQFDSLFTGIAEEKCNDLRKQKEKIDIDLLSCREKFALPNMTDLKELVLIFYGEYGPEQKVNPLFSHVAAFYGFDCVPDLKVTVAIPWDNRRCEKVQEMISPILEHVNFNPNYAEPLDFYEKNLL